VACLSYFTPPWLTTQPSTRSLKNFLSQAPLSSKSSKIPGPCTYFISEILVHTLSSQRCLCQCNSVCLTRRPLQQPTKQDELIGPISLPPRCRQNHSNVQPGNPRATLRGWTVEARRREVASTSRPVGNGYKKK